MRTIIGTVIKASMDKTIVVQTNLYKENKKYQKRYRVSKKYYAHDEEKRFKVGDTVTLYESRPLSKLKRWTTTPSKTL